MCFNTLLGAKIHCMHYFFLSFVPTVQNVCAHYCFSVSDWQLIIIVHDYLTVSFCVNQTNIRGTVKDKVDFKVEEDVAALKSSIEGLGEFIIYNHLHCITYIHITQDIHIMLLEVRVIYCAL